ncbi:site-specific integrase [Bifidobacterium dentium]|uniref:tyrosine-type recombinase/integrase n=1 Tax=Bifidobacterium dentium TaxID=1689 RepID=UPI0018C2F567|nr:site-specific integrase [Bifidobacterium dentium]MBF9696271.1 site-specific integrase [Bifidobacterium dentium]MBF9712430.1 site-specific integrase [Bifidobacterium dentium]MBF9714392.1 site-specific integrase [Bifidobacterium dentium]MBF9718364.1 site-specific integrase [Bifidobacterium dentium]
MGFGSVIKRGDRKSTYRAKYDYKGQTVSKTFHDRLSAQAWLNSEKSRVEADKAGVTKWSSPTDRKRQEQALERRRRLLCDYVTEEFAPTWLDYSADGTELAEGSKRKHREYLRHLTHAFFWKYPIAEITTENINRWLADIDNFNGPTPRKKTFQLLKSVYTKAVNEGVVNRSPVTMKSPPVPKSKQAEIPPATGEELKIIYNAMPECTRVSVWLGAILDLRIGEVVSLQVRDFNPKTQTLRIQHSAATHSGLKDTKNTTSNTTQPVPPVLAELLTQVCEGKNPTDRIVHSLRGVSITTNRLRDHFDAAKLKAERPDLVFHTLRATSITAAVQVGASLRETMRWGRHADAATSIERYQRASGTERMREIADGIESALMGHEPTAEELKQDIAETKRHLAELEAKLDALNHQNR